jgi:hypothetical protein
VLYLVLLFLFVVCLKTGALRALIMPGVVFLVCVPTAAYEKALMNGEFVTFFCTYTVESAFMAIFSTFVRNLFKP